MSTRAERKAKRNVMRCRNCGEFGAHYVPWVRTHICKKKE